jgi:hypothetical protein
MTDVVLGTLASPGESWGASIVEALAEVPGVAPDVGIAKEAGAIVVTRQDLAGTLCDVAKIGQARGAVTVICRIERSG